MAFTISRVLIKLKYICFLALMINQTVLGQNTVQEFSFDSYEEIWNQVKAKNPDLESYRLNIDKANYDVKASKAFRLPTVTGTFNGQRNFDLATTPLPGEIAGQPGNTVDVQFGQDFAYNAGISINKSFLDRQSALKLKMSKLNAEMATAQQAAFLELLDQQTGLYYYSALVAKRAVQLWEQDLQLSDSVATIILNRYEEGLIDAISANQARINVLTVQQNLNNNQQLYQQSIDELRKLLGCLPEDKLELNESLQYELPKVFSSERLTSNQDIALASINKDQAQTQVSIQKSLFIPQLSLNTYLGRQQFRNDFGLSFDGDEWSNYSYASLNLNIPIFSGLSKINQLKSSKLDLERAKNDLQTEINKAMIEDNRLINDYHLSLRNTKLTKDAYELYEENSLLSYQQYEEGLISLDRYLTVFQDYLKSENTFLNSLLNNYNYYSQIAPRILN
ncbi:MAG: TolC family protein [Bacteroidota bacterium]